jgi:mannose-6-phosphate isomerase-like protein (cupin superfamily)
MLRVAFLRVVMLRAVFSMVALFVVLMAPPVAAQEAPQATDVTSAEIQKFINALPRDRVSDRAIRTVEVTGDYRVGVYGVFRPEEFPGGANLHPVNTTEIYYMLEGVATLVTGGTLMDSTPAPAGTSIRGSGIEGGVSRRVTKGDVIIIPGHTPHWFSELETDIEYLIFRPDPDNRLPLR